MIVSIVIPETGLRAVVAMAFAATEVKKKEKNERQHEADREHADGRPPGVPKNTATAMAPSDDAERGSA